MRKAESVVSKRLYKVTIAALKIIPMLLALCVILNMLFDFFGIDSFIPSLLGGISILPLIFLYLTSYVFCFCAYHRMFLHYIVVNNVLTYTDYYIGLPFGNDMLFMIHVLIIGVFLFLVLYLYRKERCSRLSRKSCSAS